MFKIKILSEAINSNPNAILEDDYYATPRFINKQCRTCSSKLIPIRDAFDCYDSDGDIIYDWRDQFYCKNCKTVIFDYPGEG